MPQEQIFIYFLAFFSGLLILLLLLKFSLTQKGKEKELTFKISESFKNALEDMVRKETKKTLFEIQKKILEEFLQQEREQITAIYQKASEIIEQQKKQISDFYQKIEEKRENLETAMKKETEDFIYSILKEKDFVSKKMLEINETLEKEGEAILKEMRIKSENLSEEFSRKISQIFNLLFEDLKTKISEKENEIEEYKKRKLEEIDREIYRIIIEVAKKTLGKVIDITDHEKLVIEALEKAKKDRIF
jgi:membrane-associated HD superfamily phosphohydrolase